MIKLSARQLFFASLMAVIVILLLAGYFQFHLGYEPCPLCEMQRFVFLAMAIVLVIVLVHNPKVLGVRIYCGMLFLLSLIGCLFAGRQVWLQSLPASKAPACGPNFNFIINHLPPGDALRQIFYGTADCAKVDWTFLHLSFAGWALVFFSLLAILTLWQFICPRLRLT